MDYIPTGRVKSAKSAFKFQPKNENVMKSGDAGGLSGGAILADGNVALVLKVGEVIDRFEQRAA